MAENDVYKNLREFTAPRQYFYLECCVYVNSIYQCINKQGTGGRFIDADWKKIPLTEFITNNYITYQSTEFDYFNLLIKKILLTLENNEIKITDEDLLILLEQYKK